jgi:hypothetical protein
MQIPHFDSTLIPQIPNHLAQGSLELVGGQAI